MTTTWSTDNCADCGRPHVNIPAFDVTEIICPTAHRTITDTRGWSKDTKMQKFMRRFNFKVAATVCTLFTLLATFMAGCPRYSVWTSEMHGRAELARATSNRMIAVQEAEAKKEAAVKLAEADVIRAEGEAKANKIIGDSLKNNEARLRYLWIASLHDNSNNQVIYVPTEAGLPILEANRKVK